MIDDILTPAPALSRCKVKSVWLERKSISRLKVADEAGAEEAAVNVKRLVLFKGKKNPHVLPWNNRRDTLRNDLIHQSSNL